jgi:hypothetical protein
MEGEHDRLRGEKSRRPSSINDCCVRRGCVGWCWWLPGLSIHREEGMVMELTIIMIILLMGLLIPLFWIVGTMGSIIFFFLDRMGAARKARPVALNPQLGLTMADGGDPLDEAAKGPEAIRRISPTETSPKSPEQGQQKTAGDKMFWWGGY